MSRHSGDAGPSSPATMGTPPPSSSPSSKPAPDVRVLRVAQVDAGRLDDELVSLLREQFNRMFAMVFPGAVTRRQSELTLLLDALVFYFTVWSHRPTPGMELMNLRYRDERPSSSSSGSSSSSQRSTGRTGMEGASCASRSALRHRVRRRAVPGQLRRAMGAGLGGPRGSWRRAASNAVNALEATYSALALLNLFAFLNRGRYRTLTERALRTRLVYDEPHARRMVSYEYLNRQLVWREVSELALFVLPMVSAPRLRRAASRAFGAGPGVARGGDGVGGAEGGAEGTVGPCVECGADPAGARYASTSCGHAFCYYCAAARAGIRGTGYVCHGADPRAQDAAGSRGGRGHEARREGRWPDAGGAGGIETYFKVLHQPLAQFRWASRPVSLRCGKIPRRSRLAEAASERQILESPIPARPSSSLSTSPFRRSQPMTILSPSMNLYSGTSRLYGAGPLRMRPDAS